MTNQDNQIINEKCQRFTPSAIVQEMLILAQYDSDHSIIGKKVLENSFGSGNILIAIVERYIDACLKKRFSKKKISQKLSADIYGIELDKQFFAETVDKLNALTDSFSIPRVQWNLFNEDALFWKKRISFDYIIGNPPYIAYSEIENETRQKIRKMFSTCKSGKFDYCYAFIESALKRLTPKGKLVQIVPNSIYKNVFAEDLRKMLKDHICQINLYPTQQLFKDALTSASIFLYDNDCNDKKVKCINKTTNSVFSIERDNLHGKWILSENKAKNGNIHFKDCFKASSAVATLLNEAFIVSEEEAKQIEKAVLRSAVSPKSLFLNRKEFIIFPYKYSKKGILQRYGEEEFHNLFPNAIKHLGLFKDKLKDRTADKSSKWYEYGRSQALQHINQKKLLVSTIITNSVVVYSLDKESIPYTGFYIIPVKDKYDLADAEAILKSEDFYDYVQRIGISVNGQSMRITCRDINNYCFALEDLQM